LTTASETVASLILVSARVVFVQGGQKFTHILIKREVDTAWGNYPVPLPPSLLPMRAFVTLLVPDEQYERFMFRSACILYTAVILLGSIPGARTEIGEVASGLALHFFTYACIALLLACGLRGGAKRKAAKAFAIVAVMGAVDEFVQSYLPYRTAALTDWYVDISAGFLTALLYWATSLKQAERDRPLP
jgi:VanZ family protein